MAIWTYCSACHGCEFPSRASTCKTVRFLVSPCRCCSVAGHSVVRGSNSSGDRCILVSLGDLAPELDRAGRHHRWRAHRWHRCDLVWLSSWHCSVRPQTRVRKRSPVDSKPCKDFLAGRSNFLSGRCVGAVEVLDELGSDNKAFCPPETINNIEQVRVIVIYIEGLPKRVTDGFGLLANEAMAKAWPCKT